MNAKEFFDTVAKMREAQKNYFKTRTSQYLTLSKKLEKEVDTEIDRVNNIINKQSPEATLFGENI